MSSIINDGRFRKVIMSAKYAICGLTVLKQMLSTSFTFHHEDEFAQVTVAKELQGKRKHENLLES